MNIFKALSEGNGRITETNITSFLNYLLNSSTELNPAFLILFFELLDNNLESNQKIIKILKLNDLNTREKIIYFSQKYIATAEPEFAIEIEDEKKKKIPDIFLKISEIKGREIGNDILYIIIENKIKKTAFNSSQMSEQYTYFIKSGEGDIDKPTYSLLISLDDEKFSEMYENSLKTNSNSAWIKWTNHQNSANSIEAILKKLIHYEQNVEIEPINPNNLFILKSFIDYLTSEFAYRKTKSNSSKNELNDTNTLYENNVIESAKCKLDNKTYIIKRYANNMIRLYNENNELINEPVKPLLREINTKHNLQVDLNHTNSQHAKNTQVLGKDIIRAISETRHGI